MILGIEENYLKEHQGYYSAFEIERQPELWEEDVKTIKENKERIIEYFNKYDIKNSHILLVGAGSSAKASLIVEYYLRRQGYDVEAVKSTEFIMEPNVHMSSKKQNVLVSFGSSGSTPEGLASAKIASELDANLKQILVVCVKTGKIVEKYGDLETTLYVELPDRSKGKSFAATAEFTNLVIHAIALFDVENIDKYLEFAKYAKTELKRVIDVYGKMLFDIANDDTVEISSLGSLEYEVLGNETALKAVEFTEGRYFSNFNSNLEYRHGPKLILNSKIISLHYIYPDQKISKYDLDMYNEALEYTLPYVMCIGFEKSLEDVKGNYAVVLKDNETLDFNPALGTLLYAFISQVLVFNVSLKMDLNTDWPSDDKQVPKVANRVVIY